MSPLTTPQLLAAAALASPALWTGFVEQTLPADVALTRYLVAVLACWLVGSLLHGVVTSAPAAAPAPVDPPQADPPPADADEPASYGSDPADIPF